MFDKFLIQERFSKAAGTYDQWAEAQRIIAKRMSGLLSEACQPKSILDVGCGTGLLTRLLHEAFPEASIHGIDIAPGMIDHCQAKWNGESLLSFETADLETMKLDRRFDLITSSCCLQWIEHKTAVLSRLKGFLAPGGRLALSDLLEGTLSELSTSYELVTGRPMKTVNYWSEEAYRQALIETGYESETFRTEQIVCQYDSTWEFFHSLKGIGATLAGHPEYQPLSGKQFRQLAKIYHDRFTSSEGKVDATYRALYAIAGVQGESPQSDRKNRS